MWCLYTGVWITDSINLQTTPRRDDTTSQLNLCAPSLRNKKCDVFLLLIPRAAYGARVCVCI